jgi:predicted PurR-regulated permease PerM
MISSILNGALFALKLIAFAAIICLFACILVLLTFLLISTPKTTLTENTSEQIPALPLARQRRQNLTQEIINNVLITPAPKQIKTASKRQTKSINSPSKASKKQRTKSMELPIQQAKKPLTDMTSRELLAYAKQEKIKGTQMLTKHIKSLA